MVIIFLAVCLIALPAKAFDVRGGEGQVITIDEIIEDDLIIAADTVIITGEVKGKVIAFGNRIIISGQVEDLYGAANSVSIDGIVQGDLFMAANNFDITGQIGDNAAVAGASLNFGKDSQIGRDLAAAASSINLFGKVGRNFYGAANEIVASGTIGASFVSEANSLRFSDQAIINSDISYRKNSNLILPENKVLSDIAKGKIILREAEKKTNYQLAGWLPGLGEFLMKLGGLMVALIALWLFPQVAKKITAEKSIFQWRNFLSGALIFIAAPVFAVLLLFTLIGIPLAMIIFALYPIWLYLSKAAVALWLGRKILKKKDNQTSSFYDLLIGMAILIIVSFIPVFGWIPGVAFALVGSGALYRVLAKKSEPINKNNA